MDVWIIAAAAGAGYVAKRFNKKLTMGKCNCPESSSENLEIAPESLGSVKNQHESFSEDIACTQTDKDSHNASVASTSGFHCENTAMSDDFGSWGTYEDIINSNANLIPLSEIRFSYGFRQNRSSPRSRRVHSKSIKPRMSLESCLMAQLYNEHAEMEERTYSVHTPLELIVWPLFDNDGSGIISRGPPKSCSKRTRRGNYMSRTNNDTRTHENMTAFCVPRLPNLVPAELQTGDKGKFRMESVNARSDGSKMVNRPQDKAQGSSSDGARILFLGLIMGITYTTLQHKLETDKLRRSLKQTEDLVQDLQDELEMRGASTVKELAVEDYESLDVHNYSYFNDAMAMQALSPEQRLDGSSRNCNDEYCDRNSKEESMREIEAELEAELDRLASNINSVRLEEELSNVPELDTDFVHDVIEGADRDGSGGSTTTTRSVHYPVSPRDLTLRLHKVIQSRLEERVRELETELEHSRTKIERMTEPESTTQSVDPPVVINLKSGEALAAYDEAFEESAKLSESDEKEIVSHPCKQDDDFGSLDGYAISEGRLETGFSSRQEEGGRVDISSDESEDEMERLLIKQIVEKARQGSPAVLKVQRAFLSSDENYNWH